MHRNASTFSEAIWRKIRNFWPKTLSNCLRFVWISIFIVKHLLYSPSSSPDASSKMLTNSLMINNYHNYMTYFLVCSYKTLQIDILNLFTYIFYLHLFFHFSYVIIAEFCQLCLINIMMMMISPECDFIKHKYF